MANVKVKNADAADAYLAATGAGTDLDPHIIEHEITQATAADLNMTEASASAILTACQAIQAAVEVIDNMIAGSEAQVDVVTSALPSGAATEATLAAIQTAVELIDNMIAGSEAQVDVVTSALPSGAATEATLSSADTALAAIQTAVELIDNMIAGTEAQVDVVTSALPTGAATEATLAAIQTAVELIDNMIAGTEAQVDVVTSALPTGAATEATLAAIQTATEAIQASAEVIDNVVSGSEAQVDVVAALPAGTNTIGNVGLVPQTSGGLSIHRSIDLDESEEEVKGTAGQVFGWYIYNLASAKRYIKFYNAAAADVTVGTTTPVLTIPLESDQGANVEFANGITFSTAICVAATTGIADNDTGAPGANEIVANVFYK